MEMDKITVMVFINDIPLRMDFEIDREIGQYALENPADIIFRMIEDNFRPVLEERYLEEDRNEMERS